MAGRQFERGGRWIAYEPQSGMLWTFEGATPRQGGNDLGERKDKQFVGEAKIQKAIDKLAAAKLAEGWLETAVGWATPAAPSVEAPAKPVKVKTVKLALPKDALAKPARAPTPAAIAKARAKLRDEVAGRAAKAGLVAWPRIAPLLRDAISLTLSAWDGTPPLGASRVGGAPDLDAGARWPEASRPLEFVAQLRCEELVAFGAEVPKAGLLLFFADLSPTSSSYLEEGCVVHVPKLTTLARRPWPDGVGVVAESAIAWSPTLSLPPADGPFLAAAKLSAAERRIYNDAVLVPSIDPTRHQALGYPTLTEVEGAKRDEVCLLQLASSKARKLSFGDARTLRYYARSGKLDRLRVTAEEL